MLIRTHVLDEIQLNSLDKLCQACRQVDGNIVAIYRHLLTKPRPIACNILYYDNERLIGFLRTFFFQDETCEIAVMVEPDYRRQGIARQMFQAVEPYIHPDEIKTLIFSVPHNVPTDWLIAYGLEYQDSECRMQYQHPTPPLLPPLPNKIRLATTDDIPVLCEIDTACFPKPNPDLPSHFQGLISDAECDIYVIKQDGVPVGKTHLFWYTDCVRLTDIAVIPRARGRGFASALISYCIKQALAAQITNISLDVETNNKNALHLYTHLGFEILNAHDYWSITASSRTEEDTV